MLLVATICSVLIGLGSSQGFETEEVDSNLPSVISGTPWDTFVTSASKIFSQLGNVMAISSSFDFSLERYRPNNGFQYISHPSSFKATTLQIINEVSSAYNSAHNNMNNIQQSMLVLPDRVNFALQMIDQFSAKLMKSELPKQLKDIALSVDRTAQLATETQESFSSLMPLLDETIQVATMRQAVSRDRRLVRVLQELSSLRETAKRMAMFGSVLKVRADQLKSSIEPFLEIAPEILVGFESDPITEDERGLYLSMLVEDARVAQRYAYFLHMVTKTYVEVSKNHILIQLARLPVLASRVDSDAKRQELVRALYREMNKAIKYAADLASTQKETYQANVLKIEDMVEKLENYWEHD